MSVMLQPCLSGSTPSFPFKCTVLVCCALRRSSAMLGSPSEPRSVSASPAKAAWPPNSDTLQLLKVHIVHFFLFLFLSLWFSRKLHSIEISSNFCFVCVKGLSIACESRESTTVRWENSSGMRKRLCLSDFSFLGTKIDNFKFIRD